MRPKERKTVTLEEMAYSSMLSVNALVELLDEKGIVSKAEVLQRIRKLQAEVRKEG